MNYSLKPKLSSRQESVRRTISSPQLSFRQRILVAMTRPLWIGLLWSVLLSAYAYITLTSFPYYVGQRITEPIVSRITFTAQDLEATQRERLERQSSQPAIYEWNTTLLKELKLALGALPKNVLALEVGQQLEAKMYHELQLTPAQISRLKYIWSSPQSREDWKVFVQNTIDYLSKQPILAHIRYQEESVAKAQSIIIDKEYLHHSQLINGGNIRQLDTILEPLFVDTELIVSTILAPYLKKKIVPLLLYSKSKTESARSRIAEQVSIRQYIYQVGELIISPYTRSKFTDQDVLLLRQEWELYRQKHPYRVWLDQCVLGVILFLVACMMPILIHYLVPQQYYAILIFTSVVGLGTFLLNWLTKIDDFLNASWSSVALATVFILITGRTQAYILTSSILLFFGLIWSLSLWEMIALWVPLIPIYHFLFQPKSQQNFVYAGLGSGLLGMIISFLVLSLRDSVDSPFVISGQVLITYLVINFLILGLLSRLERIFHVVTPITLFKLSNPQHPLLRTLFERAPGTYSHSLQVSNLAETAATAIGADALLVRAAAYYHDIGKIHSPNYFVENDSKSNPHENLSYTMSVLIIQSHIKDGVEMARTYQLPGQFVDFIEQHHGTTRVEYFFQMAKQAETKDNEVQESQFRYSGPRPQTKEAAILMICDMIEAASRNLPDPSHQAINNLAVNLVNQRIQDDQFDECDLSYNDLKVIRESVVEQLSAIYHSRVKYPSENDP